MNMKLRKFHYPWLTLPDCREIAQNQAILTTLTLLTTLTMPNLAPLKTSSFLCLNNLKT